MFVLLFLFYCFFFFKQKTAYEMRISDWSSDVCSSDLKIHIVGFAKVVGDLIAGLTQVSKYFAISALIAAACVFFYTRCVRSTMLQIGRASCRERVCQYV